MADNYLTKIAKLLREIQDTAQTALSYAMIIEPYTSWYNCTVENGWVADTSNPPMCCKVGQQLIFRGNVTSPSTFDGTSNTPILKVPTNMKIGEQYMQTAVNVTMGSAASGTYASSAALDVYPKTATELAGWHGSQNQMFNLAGLMFTAA